MTCRVAHFRSPFLSYSETFIHSLLTRLDGEFRPLVFTNRRRNQDKFPFEPVVDYGLRRFSGRWWEDRLGSRVGVRHVHLARLLREHDARLMHAHFGEQGYDLVPLRRRLGIPLVTTFYGYDVSELPKDPAWRARYRRLFEEGDLFLVEGSHMRAAVVALGCPEEKVRIQRIGVELGRIRFRERLPKRPGERAVFLFCGRFIEKKGLIYALRAFDELRRRGRDDFEFRVIGDGPLRGEAEAFVRANGLEESVRFLGVRSHAEVHDEMDRADIFISPSVTAANGDSEGGAPTTVREAQAAGLPVLATAHADIPEVVAAGRSALLSPERDHLSLARDAKLLLDNPQLWRAFGQEGRRQAERTCDVRKEARRLEDHYAEVLGRRAVPRRVAAGKGDQPADAFYNGAWRYLVEPCRDGRLLLLGGDPSSIGSVAGELRRAHCLPLGPQEASAFERFKERAPVDVLPPPAGGLDFPEGYFSAVVAPDGAALRRALARQGRPWTRAAFLWSEVRRVVARSGSVYIGFRKGNLKDWLGFRGPWPSGLPSFLRVFRRDRIDVFRLKDDIAGPSLYAVEPPPRGGFWEKWLFWTGLLFKSRAVAFRVRPAEARADSLMRQIVRAVSPHFADGEGAGLYLGSGSAYRIVAGRAVVRVPDNERVAPRCWNNFRMLRTLERYPLPFEAPRPLAQGEHAGAPFFAETLVAGRPFDYLNESSWKRQRLAGRALAALAKFQQATRAPRTIDERQFARLFSAPIDAIRGFLRPETRGRLETLRQVLQERLAGRSIALTAVHGDFKVANILWTPDGRVAGVVDWDMSAAEGLPAVDHLTYHAFEASLTDGVPMPRALAEGVARLLPDDLPTFLEADMLTLKTQGVMTLIHYALHRAVVDEDALAQWCLAHADGPIRQAADEIIHFWAGPHSSPQPAAVTA